MQIHSLGLIDADCLEAPVMGVLLTGTIEEIKQLSVLFGEAVTVAALPAPE